MKLQERTHFRVVLSALALAALFQLGDAMQVMALGLLRGIKDTKVPMWAAAISYWGVGLPVSYVLGFVVGTFFLVFSQTARFMRFDVDQRQVSSLLNLTSRFNPPWSPLAWAGIDMDDPAARPRPPSDDNDAIHLVRTGAATVAEAAAIASKSSTKSYVTDWTRTA